jgi:hypothetical protein
MANGFEAIRDFLQTSALFNVHRLLCSAPMELGFDLTRLGFKPAAAAETDNAITLVNATTGPSARPAGQQQTVKLDTAAGCRA